MKQFIPALAGVAALSLLSGCVYEGYGRPYAGNYDGYGGRNYGYGDYGYDPYGGYGGYGDYGYPNYDYYATPFTTFGLGLGLGYYDFGGFSFRRGDGGYYRGGNGGGDFARRGGQGDGRFSGGGRSSSGGR